MADVSLFMQQTITDTDLFQGDFQSVTAVEAGWLARGCHRLGVGPEGGSVSPRWVVVSHTCPPLGPASLRVGEPGKEDVNDPSGD